MVFCCELNYFGFLFIEGYIEGDFLYFIGFLELSFFYINGYLFVILFLVIFKEIIIK